VPRGVTSGTQIKYSGLGDNLINTIPRGDLYVHFNVVPPENYIINNVDLYTKIHVNCLLAIAGGKTNITTIDNKTFEMNIPQGTQPGTKFRISGQGLYQMNSEVRGDLYIEVALTVPQYLSDSQLEIVRSLIINQ